MVRPVEESVASCGSCGNDLRAKSRFCDMCGSPVSPPAASEHKHVTVLFADVVGSMELAAALDAERLRELMNELFNRSAAVVQRYQGTMDKFTGDGLMALYGAPVALEDHALRACIAALEIQSVAAQLAAEALHRDGVQLQLRVGLNSGEVVVGEIGSGPGRYTAVGHAVGMAQRMEGSALPGTVLCSLTTARLVEHAARLGPVENVRIKGADEPVPARRLVAVEAERMVIGRNEGLMLGRDGELRRLLGAVDARGRGRLVRVGGSPGVGKSRLIDEFSAQLVGRGICVAVARCDAHARPIAFRALSRFLRAMFAVDGLGDEEARDRTMVEVGSDGARRSTDAQILFEAMGIADPDAPAVEVGVDGWRHRLVEIMTRILRQRPARTVFILEDAHWLDERSDALLAEFAAAVNETSSMFVATHRPEFRGALQRAAAMSIDLAPLDYSTTEDLVGNLLGRDTSLAGLAPKIARIAGGNPFFVEEIIRDLADRQVLTGSRGDYRLVGDSADIGVPVTVQAVLAARIDRLPVGTKSLLNAAAVIGNRFDVDTLNVLVPEPLSGQLAELVANELIDQTEFAPRQRYCFRHPLVRTVAYESQLTATRSKAHHRLATAIEARDPNGADENAALIATHLEAAGDFARGCRWHLRAADWLRSRDLLAARAQWKAALLVADELPGDDSEVIALRIAPRAMLVSTELFAGSDPDNDRLFLELRGLTSRVGDVRSLAIAMAGRIMNFSVNAFRAPEVAPLAAELERIVDELVTAPAEELEILFTAIAFAYIDNCEFDSAIRILDRTLALPLQRPSVDRAVAYALLGITEVCLGNREQGIAHLRKGTALAREMTPVSYSAILTYWGMLAGMGLHVANELVDDMREALRRAESFGDRFGVIAAQWVYGTVLLRADPASRAEAVDVLERAETNIKEHNLQFYALGTVGSDLAREAARRGHLDEAIERLRVQTSMHDSDAPFIYFSCPAEALIELLTERGRAADLQEAHRLIELWRMRKPNAPAMDLWWLKSRALLAEAVGDLQACLGLAQQYLKSCEELGAIERIAEAERLVAHSVAAREW